jgi:ApaG protein
MSKYQFRVEVSPRYLAEQSAPEQGLYMFSYTVSIANVGAVPAQLISRTWNVNDANGHTERVKGLGVVGQQPLLKPGEVFEYTSGTRLRTPTGTMHGSFFCVAVDALSSSGGQRTLH